jgi:hypothetical protein
MTRLMASSKLFFDSDEISVILATAIETSRPLGMR